MNPVLLAIAIASSGTAGWSGYVAGRWAMLRFVIVPRTFRQRYGDYQVVTREDAEREKLSREQSRKVAESTSKQNLDLQNQLEVMRRQLDNMSELQRRQKQAQEKKLNATYVSDGEDKPLQSWMSKSAAVRYRDDTIMELAKERKHLWVTRQDYFEKRLELTELTSDRELSKSEMDLLEQLNLAIERVDDRLAQLDMRIKAVTEERVRFEEIEKKAAAWTAWRAGRTSSCAEPGCELTADLKTGYCHGHGHRRRRKTEIRTWGGDLVQTLHDTYSLGSFRELAAGVTTLPGGDPPIPLRDIVYMGELKRIEDLPDYLNDQHRGYFWLIDSTQYVWTGTQWVCVEQNAQNLLYLPPQNKSDLISYQAGGTTYTFDAAEACQPALHRFNDTMHNTMDMLSALLSTPPVQLGSPEPNPPGAWNPWNQPSCRPCNDALRHVRLEK